MWVLINLSRVWGIFLNNCQRLSMTWNVFHKKLIANVEDVSILLPILPLLCKILTTFKLDRFGWRQPSSDKSASRSLWSPFWFSADFLWHTIPIPPNHQSGICLCLFSSLPPSLLCLLCSFPPFSSFCLFSHLIFSRPYTSLTEVSVLGRFPLQSGWQGPEPFVSLRRASIPSMTHSLISWTHMSLFPPRDVPLCSFWSRSVWTRTRQSWLWFSADLGESRAVSADHIGTSLLSCICRFLHHWPSACFAPTPHQSTPELLPHEVPQQMGVWSKRKRSGVGGSRLSFSHNVSFYLL